MIPQIITSKSYKYHQEAKKKNKKKTSNTNDAWTHKTSTEDMI